MELSISHASLSSLDHRLSFCVAVYSGCTRRYFAIAGLRLFFAKIGKGEAFLSGNLIQSQMHATHANIGLLSGTYYDGWAIAT